MVFLPTWMVDVLWLTFMVWHKYTCHPIRGNPGIGAIKAPNPSFQLFLGGDGSGPWITSLKMGVSKNSGFSPKSSILIGGSHYKPSILGCLYCWKHPNASFLVWPIRSTNLPCFGDPCFFRQKFRRFRDSTTFEIGDSKTIGKQQLFWVRSSWHWGSTYHLFT